MTILINGSPNNAQVGDRLIDVISRAGVELPHVRYHPQLGPIQTADTCLVGNRGGTGACLCDLGLVESAIRFSPGRALSYSVASSPDAAEVSANYERDSIRVVLPRAVANGWAESS